MKTCMPPCLGKMGPGYHYRKFQILGIAFFCFFVVYQYQPSNQPTSPHLTFGSQQGFTGRWDYKRDANNLKLSDAQCDAAFPGLFKEVDRAVDKRKNKHVTKKEIDDMKRTNGFVRAMIYDQQFYIIESKGFFFSRELATIHAIHRAVLTSPEPLPNIEFAFQTDDIVKPMPIWAYSRKEKSIDDLWLMPDFGYWSWPEPKIGAYWEVQNKAEAMEAKIPWKEKIDKLVWRGAVMNMPVRKALVKAAKNKEWADVVPIVWADKKKLAEDRLSMDEHCKYKYVAHTEGTSNSGRLKFLQNCRSVVIAHKLQWVQHHHHLMVSSGPDQNFVQVERNWTDVEEVIGELRKDQKKAERIAENSLRTFKERYLTPAAEACYWRKLMQGWATVSFEPALTKQVNGTAVWRGVPVESFVLLRKTEWLAH